MTKETMTIHKALSELKIIDDRIGKAMGTTSFAKINRHNNAKIDGKTINEYKDIVNAAYAKTCDLINRRNAIKRAVVQSNAVATVKINGVAYTVAEAIDMKQTGMLHYQVLLEKLTTEWAHCRSEIEKRNGDKLVKDAETYVTGLLGSKEGKTNISDFEEATKAYMSANAYDIVSPLNMTELISELTDKIDSFTSEVDSALSVSNAITEITIEY